LGNEPHPLRRLVVCVRLSGRVSGLIRGREFDLEAEIQELKLALAEATVQLRIWQKGSDYVDLVPSPTSRP
jgi:hypothetical protein